MVITIQTDMPINELETLVTKVKKLASIGDKHPKDREDREAELQMFRDGLKGHVKGGFPGEDKLGPIYEKGGYISLKSKDGQTIDYRA
jgi:hypothetical protein